MPWTRTHLPTVPSTNDWLLERTETLPPQTLVWTRDQTKGRGRLGRTWVTVPGGALAFSMLLPFEPGAPNHHSQVGALSMVQALRGFGFPVLLKWPNDLRLYGAKLGGVLAEARGRHLVLGIGLNLQDPRGHLQGIDQKATSLTRAGLPIPEIETIFDRFLPLFDRNLATALAAGFGALLPSWQELAEEGGRTALLRRLPGGPLEPVWVGAVQEDGRLMVRTADGTTEILSTGDLVDP